jgi:tetratricopeptide (TPR) repeat protein
MAKPETPTERLEQAIVAFFAQQKGHFLIVSDDSQFNNVLRSFLVKDLSVDQGAITFQPSKKNLLSVIRGLYEKNDNLMVFLENVLGGKETNYVLKMLKETFKEIKVIVLTSSLQTEKLILIHDIGADACITKPFTLKDVVEKIGNAIQPQGKLAELLSLGKRLADHGEYDKALYLSGRILEARPDSPGAFMLAGDAYQGKGEMDKGMEAYEKAAKSAEMFLDPLKKLAAIYKQKGDVKKQLQQLEELDKMSPLNLFRKMDLGEAHVKLGDSTKADTFFQNATELAANEAVECIVEVFTKIADIYVKKDGEKAEKYYRKVIDIKKDKLNASDLALFTQLGVALRKQKKWMEAIKEYKKALEVSPDNALIYYNMAMAYAEGKRFYESSEHLTKVMGINPDFFNNDALLCYNAGFIFAKLKDKTTARGFLEQAVQLDPSFESPKKLLETL